MQVTGSILKGWTSEVPTVRKIRRRYVAPGSPPSRTLLEIATALPPQAWQPARWKAADGSTRRTRLAWIEVFLSHGLRAMSAGQKNFWPDVGDDLARDPALAAEMARLVPLLSSKL